MNLTILVPKIVRISHMASLNLINEVCELRHSRNGGILLKSFDGTTSIWSNDLQK